MSTRSLKDIGLKPAQIKRVERMADSRGQSADEFLRALIERELLSELTFDQLVKPVREDIKHQGITPAHFDQIIDRARRRYHAAKATTEDRSCA